MFQFSAIILLVRVGVTVREEYDWYLTCTGGICKQGCLGLGFFVSLLDRVYGGTHRLQGDRLLGMRARVVVVGEHIAQMVLLGLGLLVCGVLCCACVQELFKEPCVLVVGLEDKISNVAQHWDQSKLFFFRMNKGVGVCCFKLEKKTCGQSAVSGNKAQVNRGLFF